MAGSRLRVTFRGKGNALELDIEILYYVNYISIFKTPNGLVFVLFFEFVPYVT